MDILATTLEPIRHRDYTVAVKHHYPTTPLKKTRDEFTKKKKKKRKLKRKKVVEKKTIEKDEEAQDFTLSSEQTLDDLLNMEGKETPESVITSIPTFVTREGEKLLEDKLNSLKQQRRKQEKLLRKQYEKSLAKAKSEKANQEDGNNGDENSINLTDSIEINTLDNFAGALAEKIIDDTLSFTNTEQDSVALSYAQNLAGAILSQAMDNVVDIMNVKEKLIRERTVDSNTLGTETALTSNGNENDLKTSDILKVHDDVSTEDTHDDQIPQVKNDGKTSLPTKFCGKQVDFRSPFPDTRYSHVYLFLFHF